MKKILYLFLSAVLLAFSCHRRSLEIPVIPKSVLVSQMSVYGSNASFKDSIEITTSGSWEIINVPSWITITPSQSDGHPRKTTVIVSVDENTNAEQRDAQLKLKGEFGSKTISVMQAGENSLAITKTSLNESYKAFNDTVIILSGKDWQVKDVSEWLKITPSQGTGVKRVSISAEANPTSDERIGEVVIQSGSKIETIKVTQAGHTFTVAPEKIEGDYTEFTDSITVTAPGKWTIQQYPDWVTIDVSGGTGDSSFAVIVEDNPAAGKRSGTITIALGEKTKNVIVIQSGLTTLLGVVGKDVPRVKDFQVELNMDYLADLNTNLKINKTPQPMFSTGLYAAPGDTIHLSVPSGANGLSVQIGAWPDEVTGVPNMDKDILTTESLNIGENEIISAYGGPIYIWASQSIPSTVNLTFSGAVKSLDFILGETNPFQWWDALQNTQVPWVELKGKHVILTVPRKKLITTNFKNPTTLLQDWDHTFENDFYEWTGLSKTPTDAVDQQPKLPYRIVLDPRIFPSTAHGGYPTVLSASGDAWQSVGSINTTSWQLLEKIGENFQQPTVWSWSGLENTTNKLYYFKYAKDLGQSFKGWSNKLVGVNLRSAFGQALTYVQSSGSKHFDQDLTNSLSKLLPFAQILEKAEPASGNGNTGYDFMTVLSKKARSLNPLPDNPIDMHDLLYKTLCSFTGQDWILFFREWGIQLSQSALDAVGNKNYPYMTQSVWSYNPLVDTGLGGYQVDKTIWSIQAANSYTTATDNEPFSNIIDGDINTDWQWRWQDGNSSDFPNTPYAFIIDMGKSQLFNTFSVWQVQNATNGYVKDIQVKVSDDKTDWTDLGVYRLSDSSPDAIAKGADPYTFSLSEGYMVRYIKLIILSNVGDNYVNTPKNAYLGEFSVSYEK